MAHICAKFYRDLLYQDNTLPTQPRMVQWSSTASDEAILTNGPGFESGDSQLNFEVRNAPIVFLEEFLRGPWTLSLMLFLWTFCRPPAGTMAAEAAF